MIKRIICFMVALLFVHHDRSANDSKFYTCIIMQDYRCYEEFMTKTSLHMVIDNFVSDSDIESVFITRDINYVPESNPD